VWSSRRVAAFFVMCGGVAFSDVGSAAGQDAATAARQRFEQRATGTRIEDFVRKLESKDPLERMEGVRSLGESNDQKALEYLMQAVGDADLRVQAKAIEMLGRMRATEATAVLVQHLFLIGTDERLKRRILSALGEIGDANAAPAIVDYLARDLDNATRGTAIFALGEIGAVESTAALQRLASEGETATLQRLAREALAKVEQQKEIRLKEASAPVDTFLKPGQPAGQ